MEEEKIWELDRKFGIEIVGVGKRIITIQRDGIQKDIRFNKDLEKIKVSCSQNHSGRLWR